MVRSSTRLRDIRLLRYLPASVGALAVDIASFLALLALAAPAAPASAVSFTATWLLRSRIVFRPQAAV